MVTHSKHIKHGVLSPLLLKIREDAAHNISVGGTDAAPLLSLRGLREWGRQVWAFLDTPQLCITKKDMVWAGKAGERGLFWLRL